MKEKRAKLDEFTLKTISTSLKLGSEIIVDYSYETKSGELCYVLKYKYKSIDLIVGLNSNTTIDTLANYIRAMIRSHNTKFDLLCLSRIRIEHRKFVSHTVMEKYVRSGRIRKNSFDSRKVEEVISLILIREEILHSSHPIDGFKNY